MTDMEIGEMTITPPPEVSSLAESILTREVIHAPPHYVSVYHETQDDGIADIDHNGLRRFFEHKNIGTNPIVVHLNALLDESIPPELAAKGLTRGNTLYAYPFLERGHGLGGIADVAFLADYDEQYEWYKQWQPDYLTKNNISSSQALKEHNMSMANRKRIGRILELKIDPSTCYVGDLHIIEETRYPTMSEDTRKKRLSDYWKNMITLETCLRWYKKPTPNEDGEDPDLKSPHHTAGPRGFSLLKGAPEGLPEDIDWAEILIPDDVPQKYIRVVPY